MFKRLVLSSALATWLYAYAYGIYYYLTATKEDEIDND